MSNKNKIEEKVNNLETLYNSINDLIFVFDPNGFLVNVNQAFYEKLKYSKQEILGKHFLEIHHPNYTDKAKEAFHKIRHEKITSYTIPFISKDGEIIYVESKITRGFWSNKEVYYSISREITNHKKIEQELKESEEKYRTITEQSLMGIAIAQDNRLIYMNATYSKIFGYPIQEIEQWTTEDLKKIIHPDDLNFILEQFQKKQKGKTDYILKYQYRAFKKNGDMIWIDNYSKSIIYKGKPADFITVIDITDRKKAEQELQKFKSISDKANYGIGMIDLRDKLIYVNDYLAHIHGYKPDEIVGKNFSIFHNENQLKKIEKLRKKLEIIGNFSNEEVWHLHKNGSIFPTQMSGISIKDEKGKILFIAATLINIRDQYEAENKLIKSEKKYRRIFESIPDLFFLVSSDSTVLDYNSSNIELYVPPEKFMKAKLIDFFSQELGNQILDRINKVLETKIPQILEYSLIMNEKIRFFEARFLFFSKKKVLIFIREITDKKESEISLIEHTRKLETINRIIMAGNKTEDLPSLLDEILNQTIKLLDFNGGSIYLTNKTKEIAELISFKNLPKDFVDFAKFRKINQKPYNTVFIKGQPIFSENFSIFESKFTDKWNFLSIASIPLFSKDEIIGALNIISKSHHQFTFQEKDLLISIGREIGTVISKIKAEEAIKKGKKFLSNIFSSIQDGICILDRDYTILQTNPTIEKWYPQKKSLINLKCFQLFHDREEPCENCICYEVIETGEPCVNISQRKGLNGEILGTLEIYTFPFYDQETGEVTGIIEYLRDVSNQYRAEEKLRLSEEKSRGILENIKEGYFEIDLQGNLTFFNDALCDIFGYPKKKLIAVNINKLVDDITNKEIREFLYNIYKTEIPKTSFQIKVRKKNSEIIFLEASVYLRYDNNEKKIGFCGLIRDITEAKKIEQMITEELMKLKKLDQIKDEFMFRASHELKTPLNLICSASSRLLESYKDKLDSREKKLIEVINKGGERLENLIKDLLDVILIESGEFILNLHKENISKIIEDCINEIYYLIIERGLNLDLDLQKDIPIQIDKIRIEQVLFNLISNAIKYTPKNGIITVKLEKEEDCIKIRISDNGIGFTTDEINKIFKKFGKIERYGKGLDIDTEGTGLGLYLVKIIVEAHNGLIWVESKGRNKGSSFIIKLPID